ncbi:ADP-ribosyl cyclase/cyclic ADP-ribose hydrolase 2 [Holothuria leucospilota]|uniref:ADP-ribosyl cyclase/cyclic ADP-ribose hydrolase 2 n=1 Tax=Holothuria leucospilota TaxID=206669 RepID=A0A9Q1CFH0_HOLLE|nr:ADP-ribosyl cyclase/cyclic ADP-ribose hydrolase 2 [Holothuria leucospilota]
MVVILRKLNSVIFLLILPFIGNFYEVRGHIVRRSTSPQGTTKFLSKIFSGRCNDYSDCTLAHTSQCNTYPSRSQTNCTDALNEFLEAFAFKDPCKVPEDAYDGFLNKSMVHSEPNETLLWSGTKNIAINIATITDRYTTIERTAAGYILNGLRWCGENGSSGINYGSCGPCEEGQYDASTQFWRSASRHFAAQARGFVSVVLNSTRNGGAFNETSIFASQELPNINVTLVSHVYIHVVRSVTTPDNITGEDCDGASIMKLKARLTDKGLNHSCSFNDREFILVQCVQYPDAAPCQMLSSSPVALKRSNILFILSLFTLLINVKL